MIDTTYEVAVYVLNFIITSVIMICATKTLKVEMTWKLVFCCYSLSFSIFQASTLASNIILNGHMIPSIGGQSLTGFLHYEALRTSPLLSFSLSYMLPRSKNRTFLARTSKLLLLASTLYVLYILGGTLLASSDSPIDSYLLHVGYRWSYIPAIEWYLAFIVTTGLYYAKTHHLLRGVTLGNLAVSAGSILYEFINHLNTNPIPVMMKLIRFSPFIIPTEIISVAMTIYIMKVHKSRPNKWLILTLVSYFTFALLYALNPRLLPSWLPRIPIILVFLSIPSTFTNNSSINTKRYK